MPSYISVAQGGKQSLISMMSHALCMVFVIVCNIDLCDFIVVEWWNTNKGVLNTKGFTVFTINGIMEVIRHT
jgi:hypothetical protein